MGAGSSTAELQIASGPLVVDRLGSGPPLLFLHGNDGTLFNGPFVKALAASHEVIVPSHPGWGRSPRPSHVSTVDDLGFVYLDALRALGLGPLPVVGTSLGGWIAADMATKSQEDLACLVLISPLGIKVGARDEPDFVDLFAAPPEEVQRSLYTDLSHVPDMSKFDDDAFLRLAYAQEAVARYAWEPYLYSPKLRHRLSRIDVPTLVVWGDSDTFVRQPSYYETYVEAIGTNARSEVIEGAGHRVEEEVPQVVAKVADSFVASSSSSSPVH